jgi:WD40 repeat protein
LLLRGDDLDAAKAWSVRRKTEAPAITESQRAFLNASEEAETARLSKEREQLEEMRHAQQTTARSQRRAGRLLWAVGVLVLGMLGGVMWQSYDVARRELLIYTSLAAKALNDEQFDRALRYALQGYPAPGSISWLTPFSTELEGKVGGAAQSTRLHFLLKGHTDRVNSAVFSPDGKRVVTASSDSTARLWSIESGKEVAVLKGHLQWVSSAAFSPDGRRVVTASGDNTARLWDAESGTEIAVLKGHTKTVDRAIFSPDGKRVVTASRDNTARLLGVTWTTMLRSAVLRERVCAEKLVGAAQEFLRTELDDSILRGIDQSDPIARNPCLRRGPLAWEYWTRLPGKFWRSVRALVASN